VYARRYDVRNGYVRSAGTRLRPDVDFTVPLTVVDHAGGGMAYDSDAIARSNYRCLIRDFGTQGDGDGGVLVVVSYANGHGLAYVGRDDTTEIGRVADVLAHEYAVYDESDWSALDQEDQDEYLSDDGVHDFRRDLAYRDDVSDDECEAIDDLDHETIATELMEAVSAHPYYGDWDGTGYRAWDDIVNATLQGLRVLIGGGE